MISFVFASLALFGLTNGQCLPALPALSLPPAVLPSPCAYPAPAPISYAAAPAPCSYAPAPAPCSYAAAPAPISYAAPLAANPLASLTPLLANTLSATLNSALPPLLNAALPSLIQSALPAALPALESAVVGALPSACLALSGGYPALPAPLPYGSPSPYYC